MFHRVLRVLPCSSSSFCRVLRVLLKSSCSIVFFFIVFFVFYRYVLLSFMNVMTPRGNGRGRGRGQHAPSYRMEITPPMPPITRIQTTLTPPSQTPTTNPPGSRGRASQAGSSSSNAATPLSLEALLNAPARRN
ncbi:unnamed protein product [Cochlearia groenlandica]